MKSLEFISNNVQQTQKLGEILGGIAEPGYVYFLIGNLGSGKTCFTQGIARGLNITVPVISPTFVLIREYHGIIPLYHIDLYRLDKIAEIINLGLEQYLEDDGLCVIEWAEKGQPVLPLENLSVKIYFISKNKRKFIFTANGKKYIELIKLLNGRLDNWN